MAHADVLDRPERLAGSFWISVGMHGAIALSLAAAYATAGGPHERWGSKEGGGWGAVAVNTVAQIPLPGQTGPENPVANPTQSQVPTPPPRDRAAKPETRPKPAADAIALKGKNKSKKAQDEAAAPNKWREQQKDLPNQLYGSTGQALSSAMFGSKPGSGQLGLGNSSPFGERLGWYANALRDQVAQHWSTADIPPQIRNAPQVVIRFTIRRDGSLAALPQIVTSSGMIQLDRSAQRAVVDSRFPPIPAAFTRDQAEIEFIFELRR